MKLRCHSPTNTSYYKYGARGIFVCQEWRDSFEAFYAAVGPRPSPIHSLDRIDNNGPYAPWNCRWTDSKTQGRNKRNNILITANGETLCVSEWSERLGIHPATLNMRFKAGWAHQDIIDTPVAHHPPNMVEWKGSRQKLETLARSNGIHPQTVKQRLKKGWTLEDALTTQPEPKLPVSRLAVEHGVSVSLLRSRLNRGWPLERALSQKEGPQHGRWGSKRNGTRVHPSK